MASRRRRERGFVQQASLDAAVRFGPELSGLTALMREALDTRQTGRRQAVGTARQTISAIDQARPGVRKIYGDAGLQAARTARTLVGQDLQGLGGVADSIKAGAALEQAGAADRLGEAESAALTDLSQQRVGAVVGRRSAIRNTESEFRSTVAKILQRQQDLNRERGAFEASEIFKLRDAAADRRTSLKKTQLGLSQQERNSLRSAGIDPDTGAPIPNGKLDPDAPGNKPKGGGGPEQTPDKHEAKASVIADIQSRAQKLSASGLSRREIVAKLQSGRPQQTIKVDPDTGKPLKSPVVLPSVPSYKADIYMTAALDVALDGHLSRKTQAKLQDIGFSVRDLGLPTYGDYRRGKTKRPARRPAGGVFGDVLAALGQ